MSPAGADRLLQHRRKVRTLLAELDGMNATIAILLYGGGLRLLECLRLHVEDVDIDRRQVLVREGKGNRDGDSL